MNIRWNQIAISVAVGFLMGALFSDFYHMHVKRRPPQPGPEEGVIEKFTHELDLSKPQQDQVGAIFAKYRPQVRSAKDSIRPALEDLRLKIKSGQIPEPDVQLTQKTRYWHRSSLVKAGLLSSTSSTTPAA